MKRVLLLEFNELCPALMDAFISAGRLPHFARLREQSLVYTTDAGEPQSNLEPWILWVNVHTGVGQSEHGVVNLGESTMVAHESTWEAVLRHGGTVWICGSMNASYQSQLSGAHLPDPWSVGEAAQPAELDVFYQFVRANVQEHTNARVPLTAADYLRFVRFVVAHGLSLRTIQAVVQQLVHERIRGDRWRRASVLDRMTWDVFRWYYCKMQPTLSSLFLNSTAFYQHRFWRNMQPEVFGIKPGVNEASKRHAIQYGYEQMDAIVGEVLDTVEPDTTIVLCTALSQQPYLLAEEAGGKRCYRPHSLEAFASKLKLSGVRHVTAVMAEQFHLHFGTEREAIIAEELLMRASLDGRQVLFARRSGADVLTGCAIFHAVDEKSCITMGELRVSFFDIFYQVDALKSGMHHPDGILWIRTPSGAHKVHTEKVSLQAVAPTILHLVGAPIPKSMQVQPLTQAS